MLRPYLETRIREALTAADDGTTGYLHDGRSV